MKYLAIDTSSKYVTVLANGTKTAALFDADCALQHSVLLMDKVEKAFGEAELTPQECDFFACVVGPGSFTGIRIGIATTKGFCLATGKKALPVTSFEVIAYHAESENVLAVIDAAHGFYYACGFDRAREITYAPAYVSEAEVKRLSERYTVWGFEALPFPYRKADMADGLKRAVERKCKTGQGPLEALYLRRSQAEENLKTR